jgi:hypothetical protein
MSLIHILTITVLGALPHITLLLLIARQLCGSLRNRTFSMLLTEILPPVLLTSITFCILESKIDGQYPCKTIFIVILLFICIFITCFDYIENKYKLALFIFTLLAVNNLVTTIIGIVTISLMRNVRTTLFSFVIFIWIVYVIPDITIFTILFRNNVVWEWVIRKFDQRS